MDLNHPVAAIAILAGVAVLLREIAWFVKTTKAKNGGSTMEKNMEKLSSALTAININLTLLNEKARRTEHGIERNYDAVLKLHRGGKHE